MNDRRILFKNVSKRIDDQTILRDINLEIPKQGIYGIVGRNGSGKTVLIKCLCGFMPVTEGEIWVGEKQVGRDVEFIEDTGFIIETPGFLPRESGFRNLRYLASIRNVVGKERIRECITMVGLNPDDKKWVGKYSLGMRQRLGIAQAIMENPSLIILDEPMNGLDNHGVEEIRKLLLAFTWASGIKSPVYCDNRLTLTAPEVRTDVENALAETIRREYPDAEVLMGTSTAGIAHAAITGHILNLPMGYVRSGSKDHGRQNQIEGRLEKGQKVVVVEDLISTAGSVLEVVSVLREAGAQVLGIVSIFTYGMKKGLDRLAAADVKNVSLTNFDVIAQAAADEGYIKPEDIARILAFRDNPSDESWIGRKD